MKRIFICYSQKDKDWKKRLEYQLNALKSIGWSTWSDADISMGGDWEKEIESNLNEADVAVLLISVSFLNSRYIHEEELPRLIARRRTGEIELFPILLSPCLWSEFEILKALQIRPRGGEALSGGTDHEIEVNLTEITREISGILKQRNTQNQLKDKRSLIPDRFTAIDKVKTIKRNVLPSKGKPDLVIQTHFKKYILTNTNDWIQLDNNKDFRILSKIKKCSDIVFNHKGQLVLGLYDKKIAKLIDEKWLFIPTDNTPICLCQNDEFILVSDYAGKISRLKEDNQLEFYLNVVVPIIQMLNFKDLCIIMLDIKGELWSLPNNYDSNPGVQKISVEGFGRIYQIGIGLGRQNVWLIGSRKFGIYNLENKQCKDSSNLSLAGYRKVFCLGKNYFLLTDEGSLSLLSKGTLREKQITLFRKNERIVDACNMTNNSILVWTDEGCLYQIDKNGAFKRIMRDHVIYAFQDIESGDINVFHEREKKYCLSTIKLTH